jgi:hypothetical protein
MIFNALVSSPSTTEINSTSDENPILSPDQEKTLRSYGINPVSLPSTITPEMQACFVSKLGSTRVAEIKNGSAPTASDYFAAKSCF